MRPGVISPQLLQEKRMKYGDLSDLWSFRNNSNDVILEDIDSVGEKILSSGEWKGIPPKGMEIGPSGTLEIRNNEILIEKGVGPFVILGNDEINSEVDPIQSTMNSLIENNITTPMELINTNEKLKQAVQWMNPCLIKWTLFFVNMKD